MSLAMMITQENLTTIRKTVSCGFWVMNVVLVKHVCQDSEMFQKTPSVEEDQVTYDVQQYFKFVGVALVPIQLLQSPAVEAFAHIRFNVF